MGLKYSFPYTKESFFSDPSSVLCDRDNLMLSISVSKLPFIVMRTIIEKEKRKKKNRITETKVKSSGKLKLFKTTLVNFRLKIWIEVKKRLSIHLKLLHRESSIHPERNNLFVRKSYQQHFFRMTWTVVKQKKYMTKFY